MTRTDDVTIEPPRSEELGTLADHWVDLAREQRDHGSHVLPDPNRETILDTLEGHLLTDGLLVARRDGEIVGFATFSVERGTFALDATRGLLSNLYVRPADRDSGVGGRLLRAVEDALAAEGVDVLTLEAMADNDAARRFYRRHGYETHRVAVERRLEDREENDTHTSDDA